LVQEARLNQQVSNPEI